MLFTSPGDNNELELIDDLSCWSNRVDLTETHEEFLHLPAYGDVKITVELVGNATAHVFIDPVSKIELSAKDIRSRIPSGENMTASSPILLAASPTLSSYKDVINSPTAEESFQTLPEVSFAASARADADMSFRTAPPGSQYHSFADEDEGSRCASFLSANSGGSRGFVDMSFSFFFEEISFALADDCQDADNEMNEYIRLTLDNVAMAGRPHFLYTKPLRYAA
jgi:hypothetical protein